jgi:hypothetical protein
MSLTFFYSVLLLFSFFNPSKRHLQLICVSFLVSFFKYFFLSCFHFLSSRSSQFYRILYPYKYATCDDHIFHPTMSFFTITQTTYNSFFISKRSYALYLLFIRLYSTYSTGHIYKFLFSQFSVIWVNFFIYWGWGGGVQMGARWPGIS